MSDVYQSCFHALKPGGLIVIVVKDYVRKGKLVPLCDNTARLLDHVGFDVVDRIHAMLTEEQKHDDLFQESTTTKKSRKGFFRRLAESKGAPPIDWEEVIFCRKQITI